MEDFLNSINLHLPIYATAWQFTNVLLLAATAGVALGLVCRLSLGDFLVWGLVVGFVGALVLWLLISVLSLKWALLVAAAIALLIYAGFYLDEQSPVTGLELVVAAAARDSHLTELFARDSEAAESIAATLNLGLDEAEPKWPSGHFFAGIPKGATENVNKLLTVGLSAIAVLALVFYFLVPVPIEPHFLRVEKQCGEMPAEAAAACFTAQTAIVESQLTASIDGVNPSIGGYLGVAQSGDRNRGANEWRDEVKQSVVAWRDHRDRICETQRFVVSRLSDASPYIARCKFRMTIEFTKVLAEYGAGDIVR